MNADVIMLKVIMVIMIFLAVLAALFVASFWRELSSILRTEKQENYYIPKTRGSTISTSIKSSNDSDFSELYKNW